MLVQFQYLLISSISFSIALYIYFLSGILENLESARTVVDRIMGTVILVIIVTASLVMKGILMNTFMDINYSPRYQIAVSLIILSSVIIAAMILSRKKSFYFHRELKKFYSCFIVFIMVVPVNSFDIVYYGSSLALISVVIMFVHKSYYRLKIMDNIGLRFLLITTIGVFAGTILSYYFEPIVFNTFILGLLSLVVLAFFVFYISFFHEKLLKQIEHLKQKERIIRVKNEKLEEILYMDDVTSIANRLAFERDLLNIKESCGIGLLNIKDFMSYNKLFGFDRGNQILSELADILLDIGGEKASIYRYYSDKFLIIFKENKIEAILELIKKINVKLSKDRVQGITLKTYTGLYFLWSEDIAAIDELCMSIYSSLETAATMAKNKNSEFYIYNYTDHEHEKNTMSLELKIMDAIENKMFKVYYQPQYNKNIEIVSFEALIRLQYNEVFISVMDLISVAEKKGLMKPITKQVVDIVFKDIFTRYIFNGKKVSINISADQFVDCEFVEYVINKKLEHEIPHGQIVFEITETSLFSDIDRVNTNINSLRENGFEISIDDFGTGYSSIFRFSEHDIDEVKFDKIFVNDIANPKTYSIMKKTVELFKNFDVRVVVEGIETNAQLELIKDFDIDIYQGYLFAMPCPISELDY